VPWLRRPCCRFADGAAASLTVLALAFAAPLRAHDLERTQVSIVFTRDGSFVLDVANDPNWLKLRMEPFDGNFADRVVLWVDGREIRSSSVEFLPPARAGLVNGPRSEIVERLATYRLRGRVPIGARTLRWYYGLVIDPYPLTIRRADGRVLVEEVAGDAWSRAIDLTGQFQAPRVGDRFAVAGIVGLFLIAVSVRLLSRSRKKRDYGGRGSSTVSEGTL
jgi:hypothetical protein